MSKDFKEQLRIAVVNCNLKQVKTLISEGAHPNESDDFGNNALHYARTNHDGKIIGELILNGVNIVAVNHSGELALDLTKLRIYDLKQLKTKLSSGLADISPDLARTIETIKTNIDTQIASIENLAKFPTLKEAFIKNDIDAVIKNLEKGANPNILFDSYTYLMKASQSGNIEMVKAFLAHNARVDFADKAGKYTALHLVTEPEIVDILIANGANIEAENFNGNTPIFTAAKDGNIKVLARLLEYGANLNHVNKAKLNVVKWIKCTQYSSQHTKNPKDFSAVLDLLTTKALPNTKEDITSTDHIDNDVITHSDGTHGTMVSTAISGCGSHATADVDLTI